MNAKAIEKEIQDLKENFDAIYAEQAAEREKFKAEHPEEMKRVELAIEVAMQMRNARKKAKLSQAEVAARLNMKQSSFSRMEKVGNWRIEILRRYAEVCGRRLVVTMV